MLWTDHPAWGDLVLGVCHLHEPELCLLLAPPLPTRLPTTLLGALSPDPKLQARPPGKVLKQTSDPCWMHAELLPLLLGGSTTLSRPESLSGTQKQQATSL